jgi:hypothetical protein
VLCGVEKATSQGITFVSGFRRSYGIVLEILASDIHNAGEDRSSNALDGLSYAHGQVIWLFNKGDVILANTTMSQSTPLNYKFRGSQKGRREIRVWSYEDDDKSHNFHTGQDGKYASRHPNQWAHNGSRARPCRHAEVRFVRYS